MKQRCGSCRFFEDANLAGSGWCHHPQRKTTSDLLIMVRRNELACRDEWSHSLWEHGVFEPPNPAREPAVAERRVIPATESEIAALLRAQAPSAESEDVVLNEARLASESAPLPPWFARTGNASDSNGTGSLLGLDTGTAIKRARETYRERSRLQARMLNESRPLDAAPEFDREGRDPAAGNRSSWLESDPQENGAVSEARRYALQDHGAKYPDPTWEEVEVPGEPLLRDESSGWTRSVSEPHDEGAFRGEAEGRAKAPTAPLNDGFQASEAGRQAENAGDQESDNPLPATAPVVGPHSPKPASNDAGYRFYEEEHPDSEPASLKRPAPDSAYRAHEQSRPTLRRIETPWSVATARQPNGEPIHAPDEPWEFAAASPVPPTHAEREDPANAWDHAAEFAPTEEPLWLHWDGEAVGEPVSDPPGLAEPEAVVPSALADVDREQTKLAMSPHAVGVPRLCRTCRSFRPGEGSERGWCANQWAFTHRRLVEPDEPEPCETTLGSWWLPGDDVCLGAADVSTHGRPTPLLDRWLPHHREQVAERKRS